MADDASRRWDLDDAQLLTYFNATYPQKLPWTVSTLPPPMNSVLISSLCRRRLPPESFLAKPGKLDDIGKYGANFATASKSTPVCQVSETPYRTFKSLPAVTGMDDSPPAVNRSDLERWKMPYVRWARRFPHWGPQTPESRPPTASISACSASSVVIHAPTQRRLASNQSLWWRFAKHNVSQRRQPVHNANAQ